MSRFIISPLAKQELKEINSYISKFNSNAARRLINRIKQQCKLCLIVLLYLQEVVINVWMSTKPSQE